MLWDELVKLGVRSADELADAATRRWEGIGKVIDPKFGNKNKFEEKRAQEFSKEWQDLGTQDNLPQVSIADLEGRPFISTMSDRTQAGGLLTKVNDVDLATPIPLQGGQGFMFENPGMVWASDPGVVSPMMAAAKGIQKKYKTDELPIHFPWRMTASGGDYATMTGEAMLSYASAAMNKTNKKALDKQMKKLIPDWKGVDNPESLIQFQNLSGDNRKAVERMLNKEFRDVGGLSIGEGRMAVTDPNQMDAPLLGLQNVGEIFTKKDIIPGSGHNTYEAGLPGQGVGVLKENLKITDLDTNISKRRNIDPEDVKDPDRRSHEVNVATGIVDDKMLKKLQDRGLLSVGALFLNTMLNPTPENAAQLSASLANRDSYEQDLKTLGEILIPFGAEIGKTGGGLDTLQGGYQ